MNTSFVNHSHSNHNFNTNITSVGGMTPTVNSSTPGSDFHNPPAEFPTNPITKYFSIEKQVASCGPELIWKVYDAIRRQDKKLCSVFIFEKSIADKLHKPRRRDIVTSVLKRDVRLLSQLHHPNLLHIIHPIEETSETLAFASERVYASLANILGNYTRLQSATIQNLKTFRFTDMDRKLGIYQLTQILRFLHTGQSLFHNNVSPCSILITHRNQWRLGSAAFLESTRLETADKCQYELGPSPWTRKWPKMARPDCHFSAPECFTLTTSMLNPFSGLRNKTSTDLLHHSVNKNSINNNSISNSPDHLATSKSMKSHPATTPHQNDDFPGPWSDMFSLGLIICSLYNIGSPAEGSVQWSQNIKKLGVENDAYPSVDAILNCKENIAQENSAEFIHAIQLSQSSDIPEAFRSSVCRMPLELVEPVEKLLSRNTQKRPSSQLFALLKFFNDPTMLLLDGMTNFDVKSDDDRTRALQILQNNAENLSKPILYGRIFPMLVDLHWQLERRQCVKQGNNETALQKSTIGQQPTGRSSPNDEACHMFDSLIIAGLAHLVEICSSGDYTDFIEKDLISIFQKASNLKTKICLVRYTRSFLRQVPDSIIEQYILPLVKQCLVSNNVLAQIIAFNNLELLIGYISLSDLEIIVLQKIKQAFQQHNQKLQLAALHCLVSVITHLSDQIITNDVIPFLLNVSTKLQTTGQPKLNGDHRSREDVKNGEHGFSEYDDGDDDDNDNEIQLMSSGVKKRSHLSYNGRQEQQQQGDEGEEQPIAELCNAWKKLLYTKSHLLEPQLIAKDIFPGLLPHVVDKQVNITGFRILMSTLYALLDLLDIPNNESEDQTDSTTQYRTVPAVTVNAPAINSGQSSKRSSQCEPMEKPKMGPRKSIARAAVSFVPMLHPNQLKELENSPNITRRASAHVICPLPPQNNDLRFDKPPVNDPHHHHHLPDKDNSASLSFLGLQLPTVSKLRRHSCDAQQKEKMTASSNMLCETPKDTLSRRSSDHSLQDKDMTNWYTSQKSRGLLNSDEKSLLTAQVCEGPFVRTPSLQQKPSWNLEPVNEPDKSSMTASNNKLGRDLNIKHNGSRRSSFTAIGDTVMNLLTK